jgi:predicted exporter
MSGSRFLAALGWLRRRRLAVAALVIGASVAGSLLLKRVPFDPTLDCLLPDGGDSKRMVQWLREASFSGKVLLHFETADAATDPSRLGVAVDRLAAELGPPWVSRVLPGAAGRPGAADVRPFLDAAPSLLDAGDLTALDGTMTPECVRALLRRHYLQLATPGGDFLASEIRRDPLRTGAVVLDKLDRLSASFGFRARVEGEHLASDDGRRALLILETPAPVTDAERAKGLLRYLDGKLAGLPTGVRAEIVSAHRHTVSNEATIKRDIRWTCTLASAAFLAAFAIAFRDWRVGLVFLVPVAALLAAIPAAGYLLGGLSAVIVGMASVLAGIAIDYGVHVYAAMRRAADGAATVARLVRPLCLSGVTTFLAFGAFWVSRIPGHRQLAWISVFTVVLSVAYSLGVLPLFVTPGVRAARPPDGSRDAGTAPRRRRWAPIAFAAAMAACLVPASRLRFDSDVARLDGTDPAILETERRVLRQWSGGESGQALLIVSGATAEEAHERTDRVLDRLGAAPVRAAFVGLSTFWPSEARRAGNAARWRLFWTADRIERLRTLLAGEGVAFGFAADAFAPFFARLAAPPAAAGAAPGANALLDAVKDRFVQRVGGEWRMATFLPDDDAHVAAARRAVAGEPRALLISRRALAREISAGAAREVLKVAAVAAVLVVATALVFMGGPRAAAMALAPPLAGIVAMAAVLPLTGRALDIASLIAAILVLGLSIDYGIFMAHACREGEGAGTVPFAITLSAVTTAAGAAALLFARHPVLFSIGLSLSTGVLAGYAAAVWVVPALRPAAAGGLGRKRGTSP